MSLSSKKSKLIKSGITVAAIAITVLNFSQSNNRTAFSSVVKIADARAALQNFSSGDCSSSCISRPGYICGCTFSDGTYHSVSNAENGP